MGEGFFNEHLDGHYVFQSFETEQVKMTKRHEDGSCALTKSQAEDKFKSIAQIWGNQQSAADSSMGDGKGRGPMDLMAMALKIAGAESKSQRSTSPGKTADVIALIDEDPGASDSESSSSLSDRGIAMLNAPKMSRRKVQAASPRDRRQ